MRHPIDTQRGSTLIYILILSVAVSIILLGMLQAISVARLDNYDRYYTKLAEEAGEAGVQYAKSCVEANSKTQSWTTPLTPNQKCDNTSAGASNYVIDTSLLRTTFSVSDLEDVEYSSALISAIGIVEVKNSSGGVSRTYTQNVKMKVTWDPLLTAKKSTAGWYRTCGIVGRDVYCWGENEFGQLGNGTTIDTTTPVTLTRDNPGGIGNHIVTDVAATAYSNCVVIDTGEVYCWGRNDDGQLGTGNAADSSVPVRVGGALTGKTVVSLGTGGNHVCALTDIGDLYCWGKNSYGQVGNNTVSARITSPVLVGGPSGGFGGLAGKVVTKVSPNGPYFGNFICAVADGAAYCWGRNNAGQLGINSAVSQVSVPTAVYTGGVLSGKTVIDIASDGKDDATPIETTSTRGDGIAYGNGKAGMSAGAACVLAYTATPDDAQPYCWGSNLSGNLGIDNGVWGESTNYFPAWIYRAPQTVSTSGVLSGLTITEIAVADRGACVIAHPPGPGNINGSQAYCWGLNILRGDGGSADTKVPVKVIDDPAKTPVFATNRIHSIHGGAHRICAIANNISYCWGANGVGQIGDGTSGPTNTPRRYPTEAIFLRPKPNKFIY